MQRHRGECGIIYCFSRNEADWTARQLSARGFVIRSYHAGLSDEVRAERQAEWLSGRIPLMAATTAFGMGIDKPDVRFIVHTSLPRSIEEYYQEIGRAGRDGGRADALLLFSPGDTVKVRSCCGGRQNAVQAQLQLQQMLRFALGRGCRRNALHSYFGQENLSWPPSERILPEHCCDICRYGLGQEGLDLYRRKLLRLKEA